MLHPFYKTIIPALFAIISSAQAVTVSDIFCCFGCGRSNTEGLVVTNNQIQGHPIIVNETTHPVNHEEAQNIFNQMNQLATSNDHTVTTEHPPEPQPGAAPKGQTISRRHATTTHVELPGQAAQTLLTQSILQSIPEIQLTTTPEENENTNDTPPEPETQHHNES